MNAKWFRLLLYSIEYTPSSLTCTKRIPPIRLNHNIEIQLKIIFIIITIINPPPRSGEGIIGMHFARLSVRPSVTVRVRPIAYVCIDGLPSYLVQMLSSLRRCTVTLTRIHNSKVKVTRYI